MRERDDKISDNKSVEIFSFWALNCSSGAGFYVDRFYILMNIS